MSKTTPPPGPGSVVASGEVVEHGFAPDIAGRAEFVDNAASVTRASAATSARDRGAVEIACGVEGHTAVRILAVGNASERIQRALAPVTGDRGELENRSAAKATAGDRCSVSIARGVEGELGRGIAAIVPAGEAVNYLSVTRSIRRSEKKNNERDQAKSAGCKAEHLNSPG